MDRFKFRVWSDGDEEPQFVSFNQLIKNDHELHPASYATVEQCTGLKDRNGKLIYESDLIIFPHWENPTKEVVHWHKADSGWYYGHLDCQLTRDQASMCELVGSIHKAKKGKRHETRNPTDARSNGI